MPQAETIDIRSRGSTVVLLLAGRHDTGPEDGALRRACEAARVTSGVMDALQAQVAELPPGDLRHTIAHDMATDLRPRWAEQVDEVCRRPAGSFDGLLDKARLAASLVERDGDDMALGGPPQRLAASVLDDLLGRDWAAA